MMIIKNNTIILSALLFSSALLANNSVLLFLSLESSQSIAERSSPENVSGRLKTPVTLHRPLLAVVPALEVLRRARRLILGHKLHLLPKIPPHQDLLPRTAQGEGGASLQRQEEES